MTFIASISSKVDRFIGDEHTISFACAGAIVWDNAVVRRVLDVGTAGG